MRHRTQYALLLVAAATTLRAVYEYEGMVRSSRSFAGRTTEPVWSSKPSSSRRDPKAIGSQTSTPSGRYTYGENAAPMAWGTSTTMAWGTLKKI